MAKDIDGNDTTCESCGRGPGERHRTMGKAPSIATMERWVSDGVARATDGCGGIETDGRCEHNHQSWIMRLGYIRAFPNAKRKIDEPRSEPPEAA